MTTRTTTAALMLAASTLALTALPLVAQEATTGDAATDQTAGDTATQDLAADDAATGAATDGTMTAQEGTATTEGATAEGGTTDMAADDAATDEAATDGTTTAQEGTATTEGTTAEGGATDMAADDAATATEDTQTAQEGTTGATATEGTQTAQDSTATGDATAQDSATATADASMTGGMAAGEVAEGEAAQPSSEMQAVLDQLQSLGAPPIGTVSVEEQRAAPTPADAVMAVMEEQGIETPAELAAIATRDITYPAADGSEQPLRVYTPEGEGPFPLIVYFHGGGWVLADLDTYDASARALAAGADAVVVSVEYRHAPEYPFPAAHEDANAAYAWIVENSGSLNADAERLAVAGESAGGNLAMNVAINARDAQLIEPDHMLLVYPVAGNDMETPSYQAYADAQPLSRDAMMWFVENVFEDQSQTSDPRLNLVDRDDLAGLPPATVINAEIDPLQSEGENLAQRLSDAGVEVEQMTYPGVTHEFFGMGAVVPAAQEAVDMATANLQEAFEAGAAEGLVNDAATADAGTDAGSDPASQATGEVTDVEATAAEGTDPAATGDAAMEDGAAMETDSATEPMEDDAATDAAN